MKNAKLNFLGNETAGLYIHIPFCKQPCTYCNFHFTVSQLHKKELINALILEIQQTAKEFPYKKLHSIYLGGGTPAILSDEELAIIFTTIKEHYDIQIDAEITIEANPENLLIGNNLTTFNQQRVAVNWKELGINRVSVGIQSFNNQILQSFNRSHTDFQSKTVIQGLQNDSSLLYGSTIDFIYGIPELSNQEWIDTLSSLLNNSNGVDNPIKHLSAYALTVEPKTALAKQIKEGKAFEPSDSLAYDHFMILSNWAKENNWIHYEISNLAISERYIAQHNTAYWKGKPYLGIGPSAHSFWHGIRRWNISNNAKYIKGIMEDKPVYEQEFLSLQEQFNEFIMLNLRLQKGISTKELQKRFGSQAFKYIHKEIEKQKIDKYFKINAEYIAINFQNRFFADGIASRLMLVD